MAHGNPSLQTCKHCNSYGLISRFSERICPKCGKSTTNLDKDILKRKLDIPCYKDIYLSFTWKKFKKND